MLVYILIALALIVYFMKRKAAAGAGPVASSYAGGGEQPISYVAPGLDPDEQQPWLVVDPTVLMITGGTPPPGVSIVAAKKVTSKKVDSSGSKPRLLPSQQVKQAINLINGWGDTSLAKNFLSKPEFLLTVEQRAELERAIANNPAPAGHVPGEAIKKA